MELSLGEALLDKLETKIDRKLVLMSQDINQNNASRAFRIVGAFQAEMESTEKQFVFVTRAASQKMLRLNDGISEVSILLPDGSDYMEVYEGLKSTLSPQKISRFIAGANCCPFRRPIYGSWMDSSGFGFWWCLSPWDSASSTPL